MKKTLLLILTTFLLNTAGVCWAQEEKNEPETELSATSIVVKGSTLSVYNANGNILEIFSLIRIDSNEKTVDLSLKKGCYILKVNKVVRKISIH